MKSGSNEKTERMEGKCKTLTYIPLGKHEVKQSLVCSAHVNHKWRDQFLNVKVLEELHATEELIIIDSSNNLKYVN